MIVEYECAEGHKTERLRKYVDRNLPCDCRKCGLPTQRIEISKPHIEPDGLYSYMPNIGDPAAFERRLQMQRDGVKVYKKEA